MPKLRLEQAPAATLPLRFLLAMPCWGIAGGVLLLIDGAAPLHSRWHPATLALVHAWALGVLGNAMFGSLLQFLPVAVGAELRWRRSAPWLHATFNLGVLLLVAGLHAGAHRLLSAAGVLLPLAFLWLAAMTLPGLFVATGERLLRAGIAAALGYGVAAALAGGALALLIAGRQPWPAAAVDAHAAFGVLGWMVLLLAAVGRVTMPMFQATGSVPARAQATWLGVVALALPLAAAWHLAHGADGVLPWVVALGGATFALAAAWLQWPVPVARRNPLYRQWRLGLIALLLAAVALLAGRGPLAAALALGVGLPLLVGAMLLEIVPFIAWIGLRHQIRRGVQIPGVQRLLPDVHKRRVLLAQAAAAPLLVAAVCWPQPWLARLAGLAQVGAWAVHGHAAWGALRAAHGFARRVEKPV
ncbi:hypothetical protein [Rhodanobacter sp. PCA2]|uniref:hypothetical protein n=1 Tax=Rhodanobacter sp. PCA2 TaxID=2006117 RepID=UPI0015E704E2|nr:hypothetical protein [Rhodanobacter sp. PCA2]MBA2079140.1 hypothetical protein [Rhodanobacter sp. PCA2]